MSANKRRDAAARANSDPQLLELLALDEPKRAMMIKFMKMILIRQKAGEVGS